MSASPPECGHRVQSLPLEQLSSTWKETGLEDVEVVYDCPDCGAPTSVKFYCEVKTK